MSGRHAGSRAAAGVADEASQIMVAVSEVSREFGSGHTATRALHEVSFTVGRGQLVTVCGLRLRQDLAPEHHRRP